MFREIGNQIFPFVIKQKTGHFSLKSDRLSYRYRFVMIYAIGVLNEIESSASKGAVDQAPVSG